MPHLKTIYLKSLTFSSGKKFSQTPFFLQISGSGESPYYRSTSPVIENTSDICLKIAQIFSAFFSGEGYGT
jgi:hypothetical protein